MQAGLNLGVRLADEARRERPDAFNYIILMSDGEALLGELDLLGERLGSAQAYSDSRFLLDWLVVAAAELAPAGGSSSGSGYSQ